MISYNKSEIRDQLETEHIFELLQEWGGDPEYTGFGILSSTICHNEPGVGSRKLYYYTNSGLFRCYTGCDCYFDIFELVIKIQKIQHQREFDLNDAVRWIAQKFGISGVVEDTPDTDLEDWKTLAGYDRIKEIELKPQAEVQLKEYSNDILDHLNYSVKITPWLKEDITQEVLERARIGFYPVDDQITIPHFDRNNRFIGLRGRTLCKAEAELYGKYRPLKINGKWYNHPLGMNLYNINQAQENIKRVRKAIIFEGEKSVLKYQSYFGFDNDISVACCGSSISSYQIRLLQDAGAEEIIIAFDRQFQNIGDDEFKHLVTNLKKIGNKYKNYLTVSCIFDKKKITGYKDSPIDDGKEIFLKLFSERIIL